MTRQKQTARWSSTLSIVAIAGAIVWSPAAFAATADPAEAGADNAAADAGDIVVTARKRQEDILDTPLTITAVTSEALEARGITTMQNLAASTPGININDSSSGHADRGFQQVVLRGFASATPNATTTSLFIDGVPVSSPSAFTSISSPERIEILKGPQSAFYGRNTFAGAINVVNKTPGNELAGSASMMGGTHGNVKLHGDLEGALVDDVLSVRISTDYFRKHGSWLNSADGRTLGDQSTLAGTGMIVFKPTSGITIKGFAMLSRDSDGAPANGRVVAFDVKNAAGTVILANQSNCTLTGDTRGVLGSNGVSLGVPVSNKYICGVVAHPLNPVSANASNDSLTRSFLALPDNRLVKPEDGVQGYGLLRQFRHYHVSADVELSSQLTASVLAGWNKEFWNTMIDLDGFDSSAIAAGTGAVPATAPRGYYDFPFLVERKASDSSVEARLAYESKLLSAVVGVSYLNARTQAAQRGTTVPLTAALTSAPGGISQNKTYGGFFGLTLNPTDSFSISAEGRYQVDKLYVYAGAAPVTITVPDLLPVGTYAARSLLANATYKNFTPRLIVNYDVNPDVMVYASWAKGVNPAQFNSAILTQPAVVQTAAAGAGVRVAIEPEKITNYEIGIKGRALDGALRFTAAGFYAQWRNQINSVTLLVPTTPTPTLTGGFQNSGAMDVKGVETEMQLKVNDLITLEFAGAVTDSNIKSFKSVSLSQLTGIFDFSGKEGQFISKYSTNAAVNFAGDVRGLEDTSWFWRTDWSYRSGFWSSQANIAKTAGRNVVNMRAGLAKGPFSLEMFVNNLFNDTKINSLIDQTLFDPVGSAPAGVKANAALFYNLPEKRTVGVQLKVKF